MMRRTHFATLMILTGVLLIILSACEGREGVTNEFAQAEYETTVGQMIQLKVNQVEDGTGKISRDYTGRVQPWEVVGSPDGAQVSQIGRFKATKPGSYVVRAGGQPNDCETVVVVVGVDATIYDNHNDDAVYNGGMPPVFEITEATKITAIENYHYGEGSGTAGAGTIGLTSEDGKTYGPWKSEGREGQGGVPNAYWTASPGVVLPPGKYTITDSDPGTWSQNSGSNGFGMARVVGAPTK